MIMHAARSFTRTAQHDAAELSTVAGIELVQPPNGRAHCSSSSNELPGIRCRNPHGLFGSAERSQDHIAASALQLVQPLLVLPIENALTDADLLDIALELAIRLRSAGTETDGLFLASVVSLE